MAVAKERATWRTAAHLASLDAASQRCDTPIQHAEVHLVYRYTRRGRRDLDNIIASAKGLIDGLVGVLIPDDDWTHLVRLSASVECPADRDEVLVEVFNADPA